MDNYSFVKLACIFCLFSFLHSGSVFAAWTNGQAGITVIGEPDFTTTSGGTTSTTLGGLGGGPAGVCLDPATGSLWVADYANNRVLMWSASDKLVNGSAAIKVLGQPDFTSNSAGTTDSTFNAPIDCALDNKGNLYVSDIFNNRILLFKSAASKANGASADLVLGQADFTSDAGNRGGGVAANTINWPWGILLDHEGNLWVTDASNHRVLRYDNPLHKINGADADFVLGQPDFTSGSANRGGATSANSLYNPQSLATDRQGTLLVADNGNNRVLRWNSVYTKSNGSSADGVLGQADFTSVGVNRGGSAAANTLSANLYGVSFDTFGGVYVCDGANHRLLYYANGANKSNGADADKVLGQPDFTTTSSTPASATNFSNQILAPVFDKKFGRIWVPDYSYKRVIAFYDKSLVPSLYAPIRGANGQVNLILIK